MSWDIYGDPLERGFCEVHPWVKQEYPCCLCAAENAVLRQQEKEHKEAMRDMWRQHVKEHRAWIYENVTTA